MKLELAQSLVEAGQSEAAKLGVAATIAVVDASGYLVLKARMDGAGYVTLQLSEDKAYTAVAVGMGTGELQDMVRPGGELYGLLSTNARLVALPGGLPLKLGSRLAGGLGVSGGSVQQDLQIAEAAAAQLQGAAAV
jgi:uncharacterized protein GlcG (DUF336 family)